MKNALKKHITEIFTLLQITQSFDVFECEDDVMPEWTNHIQLTHEFLICCDYFSNSEKLQKFLSKNISQYGSNTYWFDGDRIIEEQPEEESLEISDNLTDTEIDYLKTETRLPQWLDNFLFNHLKAEYAPDFQRFGYNLDLNEEENLKYLGTYFPRSYAESFCIFDNIFQNKQYQKILSQKECLSILSIGCGTGGDLIGLITAIEKYYPKISKIEIWALDGNEEALSILVKIIEKFNIQHSKDIKLKPIKSIFDSVSEISIQEIRGQMFDFILSFKMICEIITAGKGNYDKSYYDFVIKFVPMLSESGLCTLLDVTTKTEHNNTYNPILKNSQVNQALRELKNYQTLLPLPCYQNESSCTEQCFTQQIFYVSHKGKVNDISKVSYRVIGKSDFVNILTNDIEATKYVLLRSGKSIEKLCPYSYGERVIDGYKLNKI